MTVQASSSLMAAGINETIPVPALPFLMTQNSSPSFRFLWNLQFVKFRGLGLSIAPAGPSPFPSLPWQLKHVPFPSNNALPLAMLSGVAATGFFICLASAIWSGGTRGLSGSFSSAPRLVVAFDRRHALQIEVLHFVRRGAFTQRRYLSQRHHHGGAGARVRPAGGDGDARHVRRRAPRLRNEAHDHVVRQP